MAILPEPAAIQIAACNENAQRRLFFIRFKELFKASHFGRPTRQPLIRPLAAAITRVHCYSISRNGVLSYPMTIGKESIEAYRAYGVVLM
jgi:hypothetical protein